jgi:hypothetical protein
MIINDMLRRAWNWSWLILKHYPNIFQEELTKGMIPEMSHGDMLYIRSRK